MIREPFNTRFYHYFLSFCLIRLDSLARLLHNHPLHLSKYVRDVSIPSRESLNYETPKGLIGLPRLKSREVGLKIFWQVSEEHKFFPDIKKDGALGLYDFYKE